MIVFSVGTATYCRVFRYRHEAEEWILAYTAYRERYNTAVTDPMNGRDVTPLQYHDILKAISIPSEYLPFRGRDMLFPELNIVVGDM